MSTSAPNAAAESDAAALSADVWSRRALLAVGVIGLSLWAQLIGPALITELRLAKAELLSLGLYLAPLLVLAGGLALRSGLVALLLFPISLLPGLALIPAADQVGTADGWALLRIGGTLVVYLALTSAWAAPPTRRGFGEVAAERVSDRGALYRGYVGSRLVPLLLLFMVPTYAIFFDPAVVATLAQNHPDSPQTAQIFLAMVLFFVWSVAAYTSFLVPALNLEYDGRRLNQQADAMARGLTRGRVLRRIGVAVLVAGVVIAATLVLSPGGGAG